MEIIDSARFFEDNIISNHVVTDQLFRYLTESELLECSLISKKWISPCRQFLHRHHECLLRLDTRKLKHAPAALLESILITSKLLDDCKEIFYNGIFWNVSIIFKHICLIPNAKEDIKSTFKVVDSILKRLPKIQFLTLDTRDWENMNYHPFCLRRHCPVDLTEIKKLRIFGAITPKVYDAFFGQEGFPSLKVADIPGKLFYNGNEDFYKILQRVLSSSPVLQEWSSFINQYHIKYFAQANKLATMTTVSITRSIDPDLVDQIEEAGNVALKQLLCYLDPTAENVEIFRRITSSSTASLHDIGVNYSFCKKLLITPGMHPLINVKELFLFGMDVLDSFEDIKADMNAQRIFPNLRINS